MPHHSLGEESEAAEYATQQQSALPAQRAQRSRGVRARLTRRAAAVVGRSRFAHRNPGHRGLHAAARSHRVLRRDEVWSEPLPRGGDGCGAGRCALHRRFGRPARIASGRRRQLGDRGRGRPRHRLPGRGRAGHRGVVRARARRARVQPAHRRSGALSARAHADAARHGHPRLSCRRTDHAVDRQRVRRSHRDDLRRGGHRGRRRVRRGVPAARGHRHPPRACVAQTEPARRRRVVHLPDRGRRQPRASGRLLRGRAARAASLATAHARDRRRAAGGARHRRAGHLRRHAAAAVPARGRRHRVRGRRWHPRRLARRSHHAGSCGSPRGRVDRTGLGGHVPVGRSGGGSSRVRAHLCVGAGARAARTPLDDVDPPGPRAPAVRPGGVGTLET